MKDLTLFSRRRLLLGFGLSSLAPLGLAGCEATKTTDAPAESEANSSPPKASTVPVRLGITCQVFQPERLQRQWSAYSEQPLEVKASQLEDWLRLSEPDCDVALFPSRMLGELVDRNWIVPLPASISNLASTESIAGEDVPGLAARAPAGLVANCSYQGRLCGLPLGYSNLQLIGSQSVQASSVTWPQLEQAVGQSTASEPTIRTIDSELIDRDALVDRFFTIAFGMTESNLKYGLLFEVKSSKSRLASPEFVRAAELLLALSRQQPDGLVSIIGSHDSAWKWVNAAVAPAFALCSSMQLAETSLQLDNGKLVELMPSKTWNSGAGLMMGLTSHCRQTRQSIALMKWLNQIPTVESLKLLAPGFGTFQSQGQSLAQRARRASLEAIRDLNVSSEPRMPGCSSLRNSLAEQLLEMLQGKKSAPSAMQSAADNWNKFSLADSTKFKQNYLISLGLTQ